MYGIYANIWGILMGSMLPYIAAPWILWDMHTYTTSVHTNTIAIISGRLCRPCQGGTEYCLRGIVLGPPLRWWLTWQQISARRKKYGDGSKAWYRAVNPKS